MGLLSTLFTPKAERDKASREAAIADPIIDRLVAATDRRLAHVQDYRKTLRAPVLEARNKLAEMIARIPGVIEVSPSAWGQDDTLRPLFAHAADAAAAFSEDAGVRALFDSNPGADCHGMLALLQEERRVLSTVAQGDSMQVEVMRTTVSFSEPQVLAPALDEAAVRNELVLRALDYLALRALETVGAMRAERRELEKERALLHAQLKLAQRRGVGFGAIASKDPEAPVVDRASLERDLAHTVGQLEQAASKSLLPALFEELDGAFKRPEKHLTIEPCTLTLDAMNFAVPASPQSVTPRAAILRLAHRGPFAVLIARFPRAALQPRENRLAQAAKYL